jgi:hypothetical protein
MQCSDEARHAVVSAVLDSADRTGDFASPWNQVPDVWSCYRSETEILSDLARTWRTALAGAIYAAIQTGRGELREDVALAYQQVAASHRVLRRVLNGHGDHPAVAATMRKERSVLRAVGLTASGMSTRSEGNRVPA